MKKYLLSFITTLTLFLCEASFIGGGMAFAATSYTLSSGVLTITGTGAMTDYNSSTAMPWNSDKASVTSIVISEGVTSVGKYAFYGCSNATSVQISSTVTSIGQYAFQNCSKLATVKFGTSTTYKCNIDTIQSSAFSSCSAVTYVYCYGSSTTDAMARWLHIGFNASSSNPFNASTVDTKYFYTNSSRQTTLTTSNLSGATAIKQFAFYNNTSLTAITLPTTITWIGKQAFGKCSNSGFTKITIPANVTVCGDDVFTGCSALNSVTWNATNCTQYEPGKAYTGTYFPFYNGTLSGQITSFTFGDNVTTIPPVICSKMSNLTSIVIPASVTSIGSETFKGCTGLASIVSLATTPPDVANVNAFTSVTKSIPVVVTSADAVTAYEGATGWSDFTNITTVLSGSCGTNATFELNFATGVLTISGTGAMADYATSDSNRSPWYKYNSYITDIVVSSGITALGNAAFANCDVETCTIPASVTNFVTQCFFGAKVNKLYYEGTLSQWCNITRGANNPHPVTQKFFISSSEVTSLTLPSVSSLAAKAFMNMKGITAVTIPAAVTTIGADAFSGCSNIANVYYQGTLAQWCAISFSNDQEANPAFNGASLHITDSDINDGAVYVKDAITSVGNFAFCGVTNYTSIDINAATTVGVNTFKNCTAQILYRGSASGTSGNVSWSWADGVLTLSGSGAMNNYTSAANVPWTPYMASTNEIIVQNGITSIGNYAFNSPAASPVTITLPSSGLTTIGNSSFSGLTALRELTIPNGVTTIGTNAFSSCTNLEKIYCPSSVPTLTNAAGGGVTIYNSFASNAPFYVLPASYSSYTSSTWTSFGSNFFVYGDCGASGDNAQWVLTTKTGILTISGTGAMADFGSSNAAPWNGLKTVIASLSVANGITTIGKYAFYGCTAITSLNDLPSSIITMGYQAFYGCTSLASVTIPQNVTKVGDAMFQGCSSLTTVVWNAENCSRCLGGSSEQALSTSFNPFYTTSASNPPRSTISSFTFGEGVELIPNGLCYNMPNLTSVTIPSSVETIGIDAFKSTGLTSISIPNNVNSIGTGAFQSCTALASVALPSGITSIGSNTFNGCTALTSLDIPAAVESIGNYAFKNCTGLTEMHSYNTTAPSTTSYTFDGLSSTAIKIYVPSMAAKTSYEADDYWDADLRTIIALSGYCGSEGHEEDVIWTYDPDEGTLTISGTGAIADYNTTDNRAPWYDLRSELTKLVIEEGVTTIGANAFYANYSFAEISFPASLKESKTASFATINGPTRVNYVGTLAQWCDVKLGALSSTPMNYGTPSFYSNGTLIIGTITIPEGVDTIKNYTLINLGMTNLYLPSTLEYIGSSAVDKNDATLINVYYAGTAADWCSVGVASNTSHPLYEGKDNNPQLYCNGVKPTSLVVPAGVTTLSDYHFYNCQELTSVTISEDITAIGANTFKNCSSLSTIVWNATNCPNFSGTSYAPFYNIRSQITSVTFGSSVQNIPGYLCYGMNNASLTSISIPNSVQSIGNYVFKECSHLATVTIGEASSLATMGYNVFENCTALTAIHIPNSLTALPKETFMGCSALASVTYGDAPTLATIGQYAFKNCSSLTSITIPASVTSIDCNAGQSQIKSPFYGCTSLNSVVWNAATCSNFTYAYYNGNSHNYYTPFYNEFTHITSFTFGNTVEHIPSYLCYGMTGLTEITIPSSVTSIGANAFLNCSNITSVATNALTPPTIQTTTFPAAVESSAILTVPYNPTSRRNYSADTYWSEFAHILPYILTFDLQGHGDAIDEKCVGAGRVDEELKPADPTEEYYNFGGWYQEEGCSNPFTFGESGTAVNADKTIFAKWTINQYTISFDSNGGSEVTSITQDYNSAVAAPADPTKTGYTFAGWTPAVPSIMPAENIECVAQWNINSYDVTFDLQGHGDPIAPQSIDYNGTVTEPSPAPSEDNYTFGGWYKEAGCSNAWDFSEDHITAATTLFAKWTLNGLVLNENSDNSSAISTYDGQTTNVTMTRSTLTNAQYNTFCLPFALSNAQLEYIFGAGYDLEELTDATYDDGTITLTFTQRAALEAGKPYLLQPANNVVNPSFSDVEINASTPSDGLDNTYIEFHGVYSPTSLTGGNRNLLFLGAGNELFWPNATGDLKGFRAYFEVKGPALSAVRARLIVGKGETQSIKEVNLQSPATNSKYIKDGMLFIERDGKTYNAQGILVE